MLNNPLDFTDDRAVTALDVINRLEDQGVSVEYGNEDFEGELLPIDVSIKEVTDDTAIISWLTEAYYDQYVLYLDGQELESFHGDQDTVFELTYLQPSKEYTVKVEGFDRDRVSKAVGEKTFKTSGAASTEDEVEFMDSSLEQAVRNELGIYNRGIKEVDMEELYYLHISSQGIRDLMGLQCARNLQWLYAYGNEISDLTPIINLEQLRNVDLGQNQLVDISGLELITNITSVFLYNPIDYSQASNQTSIRTLLANGVDVYFDNSITNGLNVSSEDSFDTIVIEWSHHFEGASQYELFLNGKLIDQLALDTNSYTFDNLNRDHMYVIELSVINQNEEAIGHYIGQHYTHFTYNVYITNETESSATVNWSYPSSITKVALFLEDEKVATVDAAEQSHRFKNLAANRDYTLLVQALDQDGQVIGEHYDKFTTTSPPSGEIVNIPDQNLEQLLKEQLSIDDRELYESDLERLTYLYGNYRGIEDLTGLEKAANLEDLFLWNNRITDLSPLKELSQLRHLELRESELTDLSPLSELRKPKNVNYYPF
ncbi:fibronectin type III domain-containing protein [Alkalihalobacterium alkalinitrilicum]|uniref:fibronectin type III domain-containing protein n=1 Tax=Alkalihalobacterium alkalinitrilicum TaxID=427920 RepID=UPI000995A384|nr:leucine-rich repeat domain-containing protein [Alkalihalobacterium alkalinitrilicum]